MRYNIVPRHINMAGFICPKLAMKPFHDRMPVILSANECEEWVKNEDFMHEVLKRKCVALEGMKAS